MDPHRGERIAKLKQHPAWADLCDEVEDMARKHWESVTRNLKADADIDLEDIARKREYYRGMLATPQSPLPRSHLQTRR